MSDSKNPGTAGASIAGLNEIVKDHSRRLTEASQERIRMWEAIDSLKHRPPVWATLALMALSGLVGVLMSSFVS